MASHLFLLALSGLSLAMVAANATSPSEPSLPQTARVENDGNDLTLPLVIVEVSHRKTSKSLTG